MNYPATLEARVGEAVTYGAAIDVRDTKAPPGKVIPGENPTSEDVYVQCLVGARLVPVGNGIQVDGDATAEEADWRYQYFTPSGVIEWAWIVTPLSSRRQTLRLELQPAVQRQIMPANTPVIVGSSSGTASFVTVVEVESSWIQRLSEWFKTEWPLLSGVAVILGAAVTAVLVFSKETRERVAALFRRSRTRPSSTRKG